MVFSPRLWYPAQSGLANAWGLTALADQQLAGLIMWVPAGLVYAGAALASPEPGSPIAASERLLRRAMSPRSMSGAAVSPKSKPTRLVRGLVGLGAFALFMVMRARRAEGRPELRQGRRTDRPSTEPILANHHLRDEDSREF